MKLAAATAPKKQVLLIEAAFLAVVILTAYYLAALKPLFGSLKRLGEDIRTKGTQLQYIEQAAEEEPRLRDEFTRLNSQTQAFQTALPSEQGLPSTIERLSDLASQTGLKIRTIFPQRTLESLGVATETEAATPPELYKEIPIQIDALSGYHQLGRFLSLVESSTPPMKLKSLRISGDEKEPRRHNMKLVLIAFFAASGDNTRTSVSGRGGGS